MKLVSYLSRRDKLAALLLVLFTLVADGCGFQPRGQVSGTGGIRGPVLIVGIGPYADLYRELKRQLTVAGVELARSAADSASVLVIDRWTRDSRVLSVDSRNKAVEYELEESVQFALRSRDGQNIMQPQTERILRIQYIPPTSVLGSTRESELLRDDMLRDLVTRIVRRLAAAG